MIVLFSSFENYSILYFFVHNTFIVSSNDFVWDKVLLKSGDKVQKTSEPLHEISNNVVCATSKASDQPAHTPSLIRAYASRLSIL